MKNMIKRAKKALKIASGFFIKIWKGAGICFLHFYEWIMEDGVEFFIGMAIMAISLLLLIICGAVVLDLIGAIEFLR